jgi:hypothetical protein
MPTIQLIVTGKLEKASLADALQRAFPPNRDGKAVRWLETLKRHGATSAPLPTDKIHNPMRELAKGARVALNPGRRDAKADLVLVIDDTELGNRGKAGAVVAHFVKAMKAEIDSIRSKDPAAAQIVADQVRDRVSFHLLHVMAESVLFGDRQALATVGLAPEVEPILKGTDPELLESVDSEFLHDCVTKNQEQHVREGNTWWSHAHHSKAYLEHLYNRCHPLPTESYDEVDHGAPAMRGIDWAQVFANPNEMIVLRCLFEDLADWYGISNPFPGKLDPQVYRPRTRNMAGFTIRNA